MAFELKKAHGGVLSRYHAVERLKKTGSDDKHTEEGRWCQVQRRGWTYGSSKKVNIDFFFFFLSERDKQAKRIAPCLLQFSPDQAFCLSRLLFSLRSAGLCAAFKPPCVVSERKFISKQHYESPHGILASGCLKPSTCQVCNPQ